MISKQATVCSLDIGSQGVKAVIAGRSGAGELQIMGFGQAACSGMSQGLPVNMDETVDAIGKAVEAAENAAAVEVDGVYLGISGANIGSENRRGNRVVTRNPQDPESSLIQQFHVNQVLEQATRADSLAIDRQIVHTLPRDFTVDGVSGVRKPVGINGLQLECIVNQVCAPASVVVNLKRCVNHASLRVEGLYLGSRAAAEVLLNQDEKDLGVLLIDMGAGSMDLIAYREGHIQHAWTLAAGGEALTKDISHAYKMPSDESERIKLEWGCAHMESIQTDSAFEVLSVGANQRYQLSQSQLCGIIQPRMQELVERVEAELNEQDLRWMLGAGVVLTGGGAHLQGLCELMQAKLSMPVRVGKMQGVYGLDQIARNPAWSVAAGLSSLALQDQVGKEALITRLFRRMRNKVAL
jgi:cell division protein FtsA